MEAGGNTFTVEDLISLSNAGNTEAIIELLSGSGENEAVGTFMVILSGSDIGLPAGGSVTLSITGDGYNYDGLAQDAGDGIVSFAVPRIAVGTTVTVTLEVKAADGSIAATGTATQRVTEGGCDFSIALVDTAPAPVPEGFVLVGDLYVCIHEVTQGEYEAYCGYGGSRPSPTYGMGTDYPVYRVSWYDALVYCNLRSMAEGLTPVYSIGSSTNSVVWGGIRTGSGGKPCGPNSDDPNWNTVNMDTSANGYRLPTEAEWEQAANDGHTYSGSDDIEAVAWYDGNSGSRTHEVKTKAPNSAGIYDMSGNVWEWCWDKYSATSSDRVGRGGSRRDSASVCAVSFRGDLYGTERYDNRGFRVVRKAD